MSDNAGTKGQGGLSAFDQLPAAVRAALRDFPINMSAEFALQALRSGRSEKELLQMLEKHRQRLSPFNPENVQC